ncbi:hypothetical protein QWJ34_07595 [Saccharibacillus sp. CPCC 101409]|uniref:hypothetical protein n=1 Tax=Saccharibacillus sp. CPCC 101409 TaxID=3058041 RepID=UPI002673BBAA|nr:hypothetical protein [Saccharibacillus sp. CPCC 101409]MDO3409623.1 hypothetical protein [Saccharibacillus sp. CPCC 101409]
MNPAFGEWIEHIERGKTRGYEQVEACAKCKSGERIVQYALRKRGGRYQAYFFAVDTNEMDRAEDAAEESLLEFDRLQEALGSLQSRGAEFSRFAPFKGQQPF